MNENEDPVIIELPGNLTVRRLRPTDAPASVQHLNNARVHATLRNQIPFPYLLEHAESWIAFATDPANFVRSGPWTVAETGSTGPPLPVHYAIALDDQYIGSISVSPLDDVYFRAAELGYWLGEAHWGKGVMSRVIPAFVDWVWKTFGVFVRLNGATYEGNLASERLLRKAGFQFEGLRPDAVCKNGVVKGEVMWGALRPV